MKVKAIDLEKVVLVEADIYRFRSVTLSLQLNLVSADRDTLPPRTTLTVSTQSVELSHSRMMTPVPSINHLN